MPGENHGWMDTDRYLEIHELCMEQVEEYFVVDHDLRKPNFVSNSQIRFSGMAKCLDGIEIHVDLILTRDGRDRVRGFLFRYQALVRIAPVAPHTNPRIVNILRYDNAPHFPNHLDAFHKHLFADDGNSIGVVHVGRRNFPTLRNVIDEVFEWWQSHRGKPPLVR